MAVETTYICDRCRTRQADTTGMWKICIAVVPWVNYTPTLGSSNIKQTVLWCRECTDLFSLTPTPKAEPQPTPPSFEDLITELVGEMVADAINNQS